MYTSKIDLAVLQKIPHKIVKTKLVVEPLAPLSMVSEMPGSFYKTLNVPSKKMICGLIENVLGWHIDWKGNTKRHREVEEKTKGNPFK